MIREHFFSKNNPVIKLDCRYFIPVSRLISILLIPVTRSICKEVDIVIDLDGDPFPIEVKFMEQINDRDVKGLMDFMKKEDPEKGLVVTKKDYKTEEADRKQLVYIPAWLFLLRRW